MVICLEQGADLHMAQLMPLPLSVSCFSKIQTGLTVLVPTHLCSPRQRAAVKQVCVYFGPHGRQVIKQREITLVHGTPHTGMSLDLPHHMHITAIMVAEL